MTEMQLEHFNPNEHGNNQKSFKCDVLISREIWGGGHLLISALNSPAPASKPGMSEPERKVKHCYEVILQIQFFT